MHNYIMFTVFAESTPFTNILNTNKAFSVNTTLVLIFKMLKEVSRLSCTLILVVVTYTIIILNALPLGTRTLPTFQ